MNLKKFIVALLPFLFFVSCSDYKNQVVFEYVDPLIKLFPESAYFPKTKAHADVAKGEHASFQFAVRSGLALKKLHINVDLPGLKNPNQNNVKTGFVGYVPIDRPTPNPGRDYLNTPSGYYPDPIYDDDFINVPPAMTQPLWVTVKIPKNVKPGLYKGKVTIIAEVNNKKINISKPLSVKVYSTTINKTSLLVTNWFSFERLDLLNKNKKLEKYSDDYWKYAKILAEKMAEYRQNVVLLRPLELTDYKKVEDKWIFDFSNFNRMVKIMRDAGCADYIEGGHIGGRLPQNWGGPFIVKVPEKINETWELKDYSIKDKKAQNFYIQFFNALVKDLEENEWIDIYLQHIADEPIDSNKKSYAEITQFVKKLIPQIKIIEACHSSDLDGFIDVWVPQLNFLKEDFNFYKKQQKKGKKVWFYTCLAPQGNFANRFIQQPLIKTRILHWINYNYGITGYLHWGLNHWRENVNDPYLVTTDMNYAGNTLPAGDMNVVYPKEDKLLSSIRLEAMRDGICDYELLKMLEEKKPLKAKELVGKIIFNFDHYDLNVFNFRSIRKEILEQLEKK